MLWFYRQICMLIGKKWAESFIAFAVNFCLLQLIIPVLAGAVWKKQFFFYISVGSYVNFQYYAGASLYLNLDLIVNQMQSPCSLKRQFVYAPERLWFDTQLTLFNQSVIFGTQSSNTGVYYSNVSQPGPWGYSDSPHFRSLPALSQTVHIFAPSQNTGFWLRNTVLQNLNTDTVYW